MVLIAVITSTALLVFNDAGNPDPFWENVDLACLMVFAIDFWCKVVASGFFAFLSDPMNVLDALCTLSSLVTLFPALSEATGLGAVKPLRSLRLLQPIRTFRQFPTLRILTETLFMCLPRMGSVLTVGIILLLLFGIVGVQLFQGVLHYRRDLAGGMRLLGR
ncbi:hypothetical protein CYMTET_15087 [Cymbomonas tetramitiformis]|uniref:Ion transport domain-containing protein n=1 Tax=Cymbomonas tetramitiformis TaxID=36881 RepID=A0AAE0GER9_9CHLO|nr:hypothetical protein CYMTET_15087 [Cymbomonas tetramitiformis]